MTLKPVFRWSKSERIYRIARLVWSRRGGPRDGTGWSSKFSVALTPRLFKFVREHNGLLVVLLCLRFHYMRSWGGWLT